MMRHTHLWIVPMGGIGQHFNIISISFIGDSDIEFRDRFNLTLSFGIDSVLSVLGDIHAEVS